jgi:hypothetical protein
MMESELLVVESGEYYAEGSVYLRGRDIQLLNKQVSLSRKGWHLQPKKETTRTMLYPIIVLDK